MFIKKIKVFFLVLVGLVSFSSLAIAETDKVNVLLFSRDDCAHCAAEKQFLNNLGEKNINIIELNLAHKDNQDYFKQVTEKYNLLQVTPITFVGDAIMIGFDTPEGTGKNIISKIAEAKNNKKTNLKIDYYIKGDKKSIENSGATCDDGSVTQCSIADFNHKDIEVLQKESVSFLGFNVEIKNFSLFSLAALLGFFDGFNPCAMWVLLTFLIALTQMKDTKKMVILAGVFIVAESIMYFLILNLWSSAWNVIGMQGVVTKAIGVVAMLAGGYFLYKAYKSKGQLVCDTSSSEHKNKIISRINDIIKQPVTIVSLISILLLAFSVNIIELACSAGLPQTFTKVLDLNNLSFLQEQFYIFIYTLLYMVDDVLVFALAVWGSSKFYTFGVKYAHLTTIFAGVAIAGLGIIMVFFPAFLIF